MSLNKLSAQWRYMGESAKKSARKKVQQMLNRLPGCVGVLRVCF